MKLGDFIGKKAKIWEILTNRSNFGYFFKKCHFLKMMEVQIFSSKIKLGSWNLVQVYLSIGSPQTGPRHYRPYLTLFNNIWHYSTIFDIIPHYSTIFDIIQKYSTMSDIIWNLRLFNIFWKFNNIWQYSTSFNNIQRN